MIVDAAGYAAAVDTIHENICGVVRVTLPKAAVFNRFIKEKDGDTWAGALESEKDLDPETQRPRVNAVCISFVGLLDRGKVALQSVHSKPVFHFAFYKQYDAGDDEINSGKELMTMAVMSKFNLWLATDLGDRLLVEGHEQLILPPQADLIPMGNRQVHYLPGSMAVLMQAAQKA